MRYHAGISAAEYGALEDGYEQGRQNANPALQRENEALRFQLARSRDINRKLRQRIKELEA